MRKFGKLKRLVMNYITSGISPREKRRRIRTFIVNTIKNQPRELPNPGLDFRSPPRQCIIPDSDETEFLSLPDKVEKGNVAVIISPVGTRSQANLLGDSLKKFHPDWKVFLVTDVVLPADHDFDKVVCYSELGIPDYEEWLFCHSPEALPDAAKGYILACAVKEGWGEKIFLFNAGVELFSPLTDAESALDDATLLLMPMHVTADEAEGYVKERKALKQGVFQTSFLGIKVVPEIIRFIHWLCRRPSIVYEGGLIPLRVWFNEIPALFAGINLLRHKGYGVNFENIHERDVGNKGNALTVGGEPLVLIDWNPCQDPCYPSRIPSLFQTLFRNWQKAKAVPAGKAGRLNTAGKRFSNGMPIPPAIRKARYAGFKFAAPWRNPFDFSQMKTACQALLESGVLRLQSPYHQFFGNPQLVSVLDSLYGADEKIVLIIDHHWGGGANAYRRQRIKELLDGGATVFLATCIFGENVHLEIFHGTDTYSLRIDSLLDLLKEGFPPIGRIIVNEIVSWRLTGSRYYERPVQSPVDEIGFDTPVMLQQVRHLSRVLDAPIEHLAHDFYPLCPAITLVDHEGMYCGLENTEEGCRDCLSRHHLWRHENLSINYWRACWQYYFDEVAEIVFFSRSTIDLFRKIYELADDSVILRPHKKLVSFDQKPVIGKQGPMVIAVVGEISKIKGADIVVELGRILHKKEPQARIVVFGKLDAVPATPNITQTGRYELAKLPDLMNKLGVTVSCFPSVWPETFSYVTQELMELEVPVACFDLGAPAERVREWDKGLVVRELSADALYESLAVLDARRRS